jgi:hypothetical protein
MLFDQSDPISVAGEAGAFGATLDSTRAEMAGSDQDQSSGTNSKYPVVRLKGVPKKADDPPPSIPIIPPKAANGPLEVRLKPRPPAVVKTPAPDVSQPEAPVVDNAVSPAAIPRETVKAHGDAIGPRAVEPVDTPQSRITGAPAGGGSQKVISPTADPAAGNSSVAGNSTPDNKPRAAQSAPVQAATPAAVSSPASAGLPYTPDTDQKRMVRRQWWKYDLRVKAKRCPAPEGKQQ